MSKILPIVLQPHPLLRQIATPVSQVDDAVRNLLDQMQATLRNADGVGLAGNQVGILQRLVVLDLGHTGPDGKRDFREPNLQQCVNPEIIHRSTEAITWKEGCLSLPNLWAEVERAATVRVRWLDRDGASHEENFDGLASVCWQHEIDHLDGILFPKRVSKLKQQLLLKKWQKLREEWLEDPAYPARTEQGVVRPNATNRAGA
jgi:peptide deformylase